MIRGDLACAALLALDCLAAGLLSLGAEVALHPALPEPPGFELCGGMPGSDLAPLLCALEEPAA